jgi:ATP-binding cassette subfamily B protein
VAQLQGKVEFKNVFFSYDKRKTILDGISFTVNPGEHLALVGPSGVGKSTLVNLILGLYQSSAGEICFDDLPLSTYNLGSLRRRIGYVAQNTKLLSGTIMENLRYGDEEASESAVVQAAEISGIHQFIIRLPQGYASVVGENGVNFSEGQRQRLALARALVKNPDILILDEPSSALDSLTEESIFRLLPTLVRNKSIILITHRVSTILNADKIFVFNHGRIVAAGTHEELIKNCQYYNQLINAR